MKIYVIFFGGFRVTSTDMQLWLTSARKQRSDVVFDAYPYPEGAGADRDSAANGFKQYDEVIKKIEESGADTVYIVGHSSGCAIANALNARLEGDHKNIKLILLDGYIPKEDQVKHSSTEVWSAEEAGGKGRSKHWAQWHHNYPSTSATNPYSLHFSLANSAATDAIQGFTQKDLQKGYAGCVANLRWLK